MELFRIRSQIILSNRPKDQVIAEMRKKKLRITSQRDAILDYLLSTDEHPSARIILDRVKKKVPRICLSTVYSTLAELSKHNIIKELSYDNMDNRYEGNVSHHINLVCVRCGKISDYMTDHILDTDKIRQATRFHALESRFELYGVCAACSRR
jgi:Fur family peroxide stress response transcriptional regulator